MTDLNKAREWAEDGKGLYSPGSRAKAVTDIILSLPDQWVDAEKLERIIAGMDCCLTQGSETNFRDGFKEATTTWRDALEALIAPKLPTLADMTAEERAACQWMQARVEGEGYGAFVIASVGEQFNKVLRPDGLHEVKGNGQVTPLPDLRKLQWPAQEPRNPETPPAETLNNTSSDTPRNPRPEECCGKCPETVDGGYDCTCEDNPRCSKNTPNPEDVPHNEPWLIEVADGKAIGTRFAGDSFAPWSVASLDGLFAGDYGDNGITLIHKLVAETTALPEGMRLADHAGYGRVVVSPKDDLDGDYQVFCSQDQTEYGASWWYAHKSELTFLDGDQHV